MEFSLFGGALALSRYVPATNVARATRSVLSLVSMRESKVGGAQQAKRRATASNETQVNCATARPPRPLRGPQSSCASIPVRIPLAAAHAPVRSEVPRH